MKPSHHWICLLVSICIFSLASPGSLADDRTKSLEEILPPGTIALLTIHDLDQFRADLKGTGLGLIYQDPEMKAFVDILWGGLEPYYEEWAQEIKEESGIDIEEALKTLRGELAMAFTGFDQEKGMPLFVATVEAKDNLPAAIRIVANLRKMIEENEGGVEHATRNHNGVTVETLGNEELMLQYFTLAGGFYFTNDAKTADFLIDATKIPGQKVFGGSQKFVETKSRMALEGQDYLFYVDIEQALETFADQIPEETATLLENLGFMGWRAIGIGGEITGGEWRESMTVLAPGEKKGVGALMQSGVGVDLEMSQRVPGNADGYGEIRVDLLAIFEEMIETIRRIDAEAAGEFEKQLEEMEGEFGVNLRNDLLGNLSGEFHSFSFRPDGGSLLPRQINMIGLSNPSAFLVAMEKLLAHLEMFETRSVDYRGKKIRYIVTPTGDLGDDPTRGLESEEGVMIMALSFSLGSMCWYVEDGTLVTCNLVQALKDYIDFREDGGESLAKNPTFQKAADARAKGACMFAYADMRPTFCLIYSSLLPLVRIVEPFARRAGVDMDTALLPRASTIAKHLNVTSYAARCDENGFTFEGSSVMPGTLVGVSVVGIGAAIAIPALVNARLQANEASAMGTLRSICTSQEQFRMQCVVDQDQDGAGEYGYLQELAGTAGPRKAGGAFGEPLKPEFLNPEIGLSAKANEGVAEKNGYCFRIYLPGKDKAIPEKGKLPVGAATYADRQEGRWICYAWPVEFGKTGNRAFVVDQNGEVHSVHNYDKEYSGPGNQPAPEAALSLEEEGNAANLETPIEGNGGRTGDGGYWMPVWD